LFRSNGSSGYAQLVGKPGMGRFARESWMPCHEVWKSFDFARRSHHPHTSYGSRNLGQPEGHGQDQVGVRNGKDRRHEKRQSDRDAPLCPKLRQRPIHHSLLTIEGFDQGVRQLQILFERKSTGPDRLGRSDETNKI